jgi:hypothetical protein
MELMRKKAIVYPCTAAVLGIVGGLIRFFVNKCVYDEYGKVISGHPGVIIMTVYAVVCCIIMASLAYISGKSASGATTFDSVFTVAGTSSHIVMTVLGIMLAIAGFAYYKSAQHTSMDLLYAIFAVLSALAVIVIPWTVGRPGSSLTRCVFALFPSIFACLWLIILYRTDAGNPALYEYGFECVAIAACALAYFYLGAYIYSDGKFGRTVASCLIAVLMCFISSADSTGAQQYLFIIHGVVLCLTSVRFIAGAGSEKTPSDVLEDNA